MIVYAIPLAGAGAAGGVRYGESEGVRVALVHAVRIFVSTEGCSRIGFCIIGGNGMAYLEKETVEGSLADTGWARNNDRTRIANWVQQSR